MCGRMLVAEISACLRNCLSSCITVSAGVFVGLLQLNFKLDEVDRSTKGSVPCSCPNKRGEGMWEVLLSQDLVSCCFQIHLYSSMVVLSGRVESAQCNHLNSGIHLSFLFTKSRYKDFEPTCSPDLSLVMRLHKALQCTVLCLIFALVEDMKC